jgi:tRNA(fMet)-specific endonuclease VapC
MYLLDTDTIIYALKGHPRAAERFASEAHRPKALSVVTYGELFYGAMKSAAPQANLAKVRRVAELFPVVEVSRAIMETSDRSRRSCSNTEELWTTSIS